MNNKYILVSLLVTVAGQSVVHADAKVDDQLFEAIDHMDILAVKQALQQGASMAAKKKYQTPFPYAAMKALVAREHKQEKEAVVLALVDALPANDVADFVLAAGMGMLNVVKKMRPTINDINATEPVFGDTALTAAAHGYEGTAEVVAYLINEKADVNAKGQRQRINTTPLHNALVPDRDNGNVIANLLLDHGVQVADQDLVAVAQGTSLPLLTRILAKTGNVDAHDDIGDTALSVAIDRGHNKEIINFLAQKANVNAVSPNDPDSILVKALTHYYFFNDATDLSVIEELLKRGAVIDERALAFAQGDFDKVNKLTDQKKFDWYNALKSYGSPDAAKKDAVLALFATHKK